MQLIKTLGALCFFVLFGLMISFYVRENREEPVGSFGQILTASVTSTAVQVTDSDTQVFAGNSRAKTIILCNTSTSQTFYSLDGSAAVWSGFSLEGDINPCHTFDLTSNWVRTIHGINAAGNSTTTIEVFR